ncbi:multiple epidermal growth factor-like domains protein 11 [Contarinia nasturtii]|uniref:multiple epidermal growth factor-like domains protein 11 n=1 Tax=Contarinia nasturtii TaxID=265458 RepID=UPI0012D43313|nr:multiple epidermal growth factor-like domains protein 11 [Contarinia nasturtii]
MIIFQEITLSLFILLICVDFVRSQARCSNNKAGYYPKCDCDGENYGYNGISCVLMCPSISEGVYPKCKCRYGANYDKLTNSCPNPKCPKNSTADSVYPNCKCTGNNQEYNVYLNECNLVCPEDSIGYFPDCKCNDEFLGFNKDLFKCSRCPDKSTYDSIYPNCKTDTIVNATFDELDNEFKVCHSGSYGKFPDCTCENGNDYYQSEDSYYGGFYGWQKAGCLNCPYKLNGDYPNCECPTGEVFNGEKCKICAWNGEGTFPNCTCHGDAVYDEKADECRICPEQSTGIYPNCTCKYPLYFRRYLNRCVDCDDATGIYPNCTCTGEKAGFDLKWKRCYDCPKDAIGHHPNCKCENKDHVYDPGLRFCNHPCEDGVNVSPFCTCPTYYKHHLVRETGKCEPYAYVGRPCPPYAIGKGPNCHCLQTGHFFITYGWGCFTEYSVGGVTFSCKDSNCSQLLSSAEIEPKSIIRNF